MIRRLYDNLEEWIGSALLVLLCLIAVIQVAGRYVFSNPPTWTEELGTYVFVYLVFIGSSLALKKNEHFALEMLVDQFPATVRRCFKVFAWLLVIVCSAMITWYGTRYMMKGWNITTPGMEIPRALPLAAVPIGGFLMLVRSVEGLFRVWKHREIEITREVNPAS